MADVRCDLIRLAMRCVMTRVLPLPGPARMSRRPVDGLDGLALGGVEVCQQVGCHKRIIHPEVLAPLMVSLSIPITQSTPKAQVRLGGWTGGS